MAIKVDAEAVDAEIDTEDMEVENDFGYTKSEWDRVDLLTRKHLYALRRKAKRRGEVFEFNRRFGGFGYVGGNVLPPRAAAAAEDKIEAAKNEHWQFPAPVVDPKPKEVVVDPAVHEEDDFARLQANEKAGKYVGKFRPGGKIVKFI